MMYIIDFVGWFLAGSKGGPTGIVSWQILCNTAQIVLNLRNMQMLLCDGTGRW